MFFEILSRMFQLKLKSTKDNGTIHEYQYTFLIMSRSILLTVRNVSDKRSLREKPNTLYIQ